jgi:hypothetical protein
MINPKVSILLGDFKKALSVKNMGSLRKSKPLFLP